MSEALFRDLAGELQAADAAVVESTTMASRCLLAGRELPAMPDHQTGALFVKLPARRVRELVESKIDGPFAPAGRAFREWVALAGPDETLWQKLLREGEAFVTAPPD